jgi:hypothetical protein
MRTVILTVLAFVLVGFIFFSAAAILRSLSVEPTPPGQYPLQEPSPEWPSIERIRPYYPSSAMGDNTAISADVVGPKVDCLTGSASCF